MHVSARDECAVSWTYTRERTSNRAAPSPRSAMVVTGLESLKVARKSKKASASLCSESPMVECATQGK